MRESELEPLDPALSQLLDAERRIAKDAVADASVETALSRVERSAAALSGVLARAGTGALAKLGMALGLVSAGAVGGAVGYARLHREAPARIVTVTRVVERVVERDRPVPVADAVELARPPEVVTAVRPHTEPPAVQPRHANGQDDLAAEQELLEIARTGVGRRQWQSALDALSEHAARFPRGQLSEEREGLWVQALIGAGRYDQARARAARFGREHPDSIMGSAIDQAVRSIP